LTRKEESVCLRAEQSRAEQSRAEQSRAEQSRITALFFMIHHELSFKSKVGLFVLP
jgi:hypothetical protein